jgi:hypothetical protein
MVNKMVNLAKKTYGGIYSKIVENVEKMESPQALKIKSSGALKIKRSGGDREGGSLCRVY